MTPTPSEIAVIIVTFHSADHIRACLRSIPPAAPEQTLHLIIVDNNSGDATREIVAACRSELASARIHFQTVYNEANLGFTRAVNQGLALCPPPATVLLLNPDTILSPMSLHRLCAALHAESDIGAVAPQMQFPPADGGEGLPPTVPAGAIQPSCRRFPRPSDLFNEAIGLSRLFPKSATFNRWKMGDFDHQHARDVDQPQGACLLVKAEVIETIGAMDEQFPLFFSDVDWCRRIWGAGWRIRFEPSVRIYHAKGASVNKMRPQAIWSSHQSFWRYFRKYANSPMDSVMNVLVAPVLFATAVVRIASCYLPAGHKPAQQEPQPSAAS